MSAPIAKDPRRWINLFSFGLEKCSAQALTYGKCLVSKAETIGKNACAAEWQEFQACYKQVMRDGKRYRRV